MKYIKISDKLEISKVIAGCMRCGDNGTDRSALLRFAEECLDMGITTFDHAPVYGGYRCEQMFGDAVLRPRPELRKRIKLVSKAGIVLPGKEGNKTIYYHSGREEIIKEVEASLIKLGTDYLDLLLIHRPDPLADPAETAAALEQLVKEGKIIEAGVSNFMPSQFTMLQSFLSIPLVTNQMELSVKNTENFFNGVTDDAFTRRMPLMAWSPLGGGSIFSSKEEQAVRLRERLGEIAQEKSIAVDILMYAWLFVHPVKIAAITGTMRIERIRKAVEALEVTLTYDEWYRILEASRGYSVP